jgi:hypothetical protein
MPVHERAKGELAMFNRLLLAIGIASTAVGLLDGLTNGQEPAKSSSSKDQSTAREKFVPLGEVSGKLQKVDATERTLTIEVSVPYVSGKRIERKTQVLEFRTNDDSKVRWHLPPIKYDEKGRQTRYTATELRELKDTGLPGYRAEFDDLKAGQLVQLYLKKSKDAKSGGKDQKEQPKVIASLIMILSDTAR